MFSIVFFFKQTEIELKPEFIEIDKTNNLLHTKYDIERRLLVWL